MTSAHAVKRSLRYWTVEPLGPFRWRVIDPLNRIAGTFESREQAVRYASRCMLEQGGAMYVPPPHERDDFLRGYR
jgi:hypothetical protein